MSNERLPLYIQIQDYFKDLIASGQLKVSDKIPSEKELMEQFGVSRITVANALIQLAKEGWIYRIPGRGSFVSESAELAQAGLQEPSGVEEWKRRDNSVLRSGVPDEQAKAAIEAVRRQRSVVMIIPTMEDFFALRLVQGINQVLQQKGCRFYISLSNHSITLEKELILSGLDNGISGLIIFPSDAETYNEEILALKLRNYPFVLIDRPLAGVDTHVVSTDSLNGAKLALSHLWDLGHRDIAICSDTPLPTITVGDRITGYMEALKLKGAMINPAMILTDFQVDYGKISEEHPLYRFIKSRMATAYITLNARLGVHIATIARRIGLRVPEDISILTFDDPSSGYDEYGSFTHISQSEEEMGRMAADILMQLLDQKGQPGKYSKIILEPKLVVRQTTGPVKD